MKFEFLLINFGFYEISGGIHLARRPFLFGRQYFAQAEPGHIAKYVWMRIQVAQGRPDFLGKNAAGAKRDIAINDSYF